MPALRDVSVIDSNLWWPGRKSISGQRGYDYIEVSKHWKHVQVVEKAARPSVRKNQRNTRTGRRTLIDEMNALAHKVVESIEPAFPGTPVELIGPVRDEALQPFELSALLPPYAGDLVGPPGTA
jgi:hypothetical protein